MKKIMLTTLLFAQVVFAALESPFISNVKGLSVANSHTLLEKADGLPLVIRGMAPQKSQISELVELGIKKVLIFKNETKNEVQDEIKALRDNGYSSRDIVHIPFLWKDIGDFKSACQMTVKALKVIEDSSTSSQAIFFHCTVGEDRTGYLAGLYQLNNTDRALDDVFQNEMCARGYESGNTQKPHMVVAKIRTTLTPTFVKMAALIAEWRRQGHTLNESLCPDDVEIKISQLKCR